MPVKKVVPPVVIADKPTKPTMGPLVVMSGFLTKRNRTLNRWRQRWWQLLDNGILFYYNSDDRAKQLGQIDIAHSCYDVKLGRENCPVSFPRVAPSCCCLSFTVLKRSYYLYAPTAAEATKWAETIKNASRVLNRRVVAGVERRKAPDPPGPPRPPSCPPNMRINRNFIHTPCTETFSVSNTLEDSLDMSFQFSGGRSTFATSRMKMASSMPDLLDRVGYSPSPPPSSQPDTRRNPNDRLWLDGSPYPVTTSTFGQTFPSPPASCAGSIEVSAELQELSISPVPSPVAASASLPTKAVTFYDQEATALNFQRRGSESNMNGRRVLVSPRYKLQNRCSLPIIYESSAESRQPGATAKSSLHHRPASCVPNPLSATFSSATIPRAKPSVTRVPVFPGAMLGNNIQRRGINGNLAPGKPILQPQPLPRHRKRAQSTSNHLENNKGATYRPVPKPRKSKDMLIDPNQAPLKRAMSCDFIDSNHVNKSTRLEDAVTRILPATSPTESERSVSLTTSDVVTATSNSAKSFVLPRRKAPPPPTKNGESAVPPRPKRDSGPPNFVPPPPPVEELDDNTGTPSICSS